jgi:hypothetical protein
MKSLISYKAKREGFIMGLEMVDLHNQFEFATSKWRKIACGKLKWTLIFAKE